MIKLLSTTAVAFAILLLVNTDSAEAQYLGSNGCSSCGYSGLLGSPYALGRVPDPPYFAIHPPVYYSQPVARTYGYSPYAYSGGVLTPDVQAPMPSAKVLKNPYVTPTKAKPKKEFDRNLTKASEPVEITNPFVNKSKTKMVSY